MHGARTAEGGTKELDRRKLGPVVPFTLGSVFLLHFPAETRPFSHFIVRGFVPRLVPSNPTPMRSPKMNLQAIGGVPLLPTALTFCSRSPSKRIAQHLVLSGPVHVVCLFAVRREATIVAHKHGHVDNWLFSPRGSFILDELDVPFQLLGMKIIFKVMLRTLSCLGYSVEKSAWCSPGLREPAHE